jgi:predicted enzyme related to lactoylglutathione lyase
MIRGIESIILFSESAKKLAAFYREKVGLKVTSEMVMGENDEECYVFALTKGGPAFNIMDHSDVKGKNKDPKRFIFNLEVDDIEREVARLKKAKVTLIQDSYHVQDYGYIATFADVDGNYFQLVQVRG